MKSFMCSMPSPVLAETSRTGQPSGSSDLASSRSFSVARSILFRTMTAWL